MLAYVVHALKKILETEPKDVETSIVPLKIIQNFYMDHPNLIDLTIKEISVHILRYIFNYSTGFEYS